MGSARPHDAGPKIAQAVQQAVALDDTLAEAHYALALEKTWGEWNWGAGEQAFERAIELNPNYADVRAYYAHYLMLMRRTEEAEAQLERALQLVPFNGLFQSL